MKIHEYQAKELLSRFQIPVPFGRVVFSAEEAGAITYREFVLNGIDTIVLKVQVHAGGRGKGIVVDRETGQPVEYEGKQVRGVMVVSGGNIADKAYRLAKVILGNKLVTVQTGKEGKVIHKLLIEQGVALDREYYLGITLDRKRGQNVMMASSEGGVEIEEVAREHPEKIFKEAIHPAYGLFPFQARRLGFRLGFSGNLLKQFVRLVLNLAKAYEELDCSLLEINPLVTTHDGQLLALDAKMNFDDNALYRHSDYQQLRDIAEEDPLEVEAARYGLNYIRLDGNVGCMVNGAGLAMATMDLIKLAGGEPANFLDVGGGANVERIANGFRIMMSDPNVKAVLINIFGGIVRCDRVAQGIVQALQQVEVTVPVIVRLEGTNAEEGRRILENAGLRFTVAKTFKEAAEKVTEAIRQAEAVA